MTIGQYLQPTPLHHPVIDYVHPDVFAMYKEEGMSRGFAFVESGPLVRSSYHAERHL
jgi:lipoic acid synthetase